MRGREAVDAKVNKNRTSEKMQTVETTSTKNGMKIHRKDRDTGEQERQTQEEKGIHELKRGIRKTGPGCLWKKKKKKKTGEGNHG